MLELYHSIDMKKLIDKYMKFAYTIYTSEHWPSDFRFNFIAMSQKKAQH
jgi:hypothetical protein